ncbi:MAG TPA: 3-deoxy-8-phosphooctulonate synthase [Chitinophagales bacterium]|nr:3-deoxy-8-phosphooctulonate synthase [Chitinophagales bacterium]HRK26318.1 3-deoxy-8-phosphooctulonate synthase [Chitinophagales bacterium]
MLQQIPFLKHLDKGNFFLIAGPCAVESEEITSQIAETLATITDQLQIPFIFKASYRKANRSRLDSFTGIGDENAFAVLEKLRNNYQLPITTDIHLPDEAATVAQFADVLQIPAFLCRQTDLLVAAAQTGKTVNIKKGQFLSPQAMQFAIDKVRQSGNPHVMVTERGTTFGYTDLVVDFRSIPIMQAFEVPVVLDCTHSLQQPNQSAGVTGGLPHLINTIARAGIAAGVNGIFIETHPQPEKAKSDGANMLPLHQIEKLLTQLVQIKRVIA